MSNFARAITDIATTTVETGEAVIVGIGCEIKSVKIVDGIFQFRARVRLPHASAPAWVHVQTDLDLPALTDKGSAQRALQVGRPLLRDEHTVPPIAFRPTLKQRTWIKRRAERKGKSLSEYLRGLLREDGMPS